MTVLNIPGHYTWQGLNVEQANKAIRFWLNPPNGEHQPLVITITKDDPITAALYTLLSQALSKHEDLPHWQGTLTTSANFIPRQSYYFTNGEVTVLFDHGPGPCLNLQIYNRAGTIFHRAHFNAIASVLSFGFITDLAHAFFLASQP